MMSTHQLDDQTKLSRFERALGASASELSIDELTHELETHGIDPNRIQNGVADLFRKAGLPLPKEFSPEPEWLERARGKKKWFQEQLKLVKEKTKNLATEIKDFGTGLAEPSPVFYRNKKHESTLDEPSSADQITLEQDHALLELLSQMNDDKFKTESTPDK